MHDQSKVDPSQYQDCFYHICLCGMVHIKEPLLLIGKSSPRGGSGFALSLSEWSVTICLTPYKYIYATSACTTNVYL